MSSFNKKKTRSDPFAKREAKNYANPIASREHILDLLKQNKQALSFISIAKQLQVDKTQNIALKRRLHAMLRDGQIQRIGKNYQLLNALGKVCGKVISKNSGIGFLIPDDGSKDLFLAPKQMLRLMHGDKVTAQIIGENSKGKLEGHVLEIKQRAITTLVGRIQQVDNHIEFKADNHHIHNRILIPKHHRHGAKAGEWVAIEILSYPEASKPATAQITKIIGNKHSPAMITEMAIQDKGIPYEWTQEVNKAVKHLPKKVLKKQLKHREDLRNLPLVTIDGEDARDFDDAVYCEPKGKGWRLIVAIADVSSYVKPDSALDEAAKERGTSVYFPNQVVPMLPEALSNGLCSLKPKQDRLCLACEITVNHHGGIRHKRFFSAVMHSHARLTYTQVAAALDGDKNQIPKSLNTPIKNLYNLYQLLLKRRKKRGALEFETIESQFTFNHHGDIKDLTALERNDAHRLIEEMMLLANVAAATWLSEQEIPFLYRVHPHPNAVKLADLRGYLKGLGLQLYGKDQPKTKHYSALLEKTHDRPDHKNIQTVLLRSLPLAQYQPENGGHFGLGYDYYAHFTSPIRRYPDLITHRAIYACLEHKKKHYPYNDEAMIALGVQCSETERRAENASRDVVSRLKTIYMEDKVGQQFDGVISAVTAFGLFVQLDDLFIEGLVHITTLYDDYYSFNPEQHTLIGERHGHCYGLYDKMRIQVTRVDTHQRKIDFYPLSHTSNA